MIWIAALEIVGVSALIGAALALLRWLADWRRTVRRDTTRRLVEMLRDGGQL